MFYTTACYLYSPSPEKTCDFLLETLGFELVEEKPVPLLSNGSLCLRLVRGEMPAVLELQCSNLEQDSAQLLQYSNIEKRTAVVHMHDYLEQHLYCADIGVTLILSQPLSEDDRDELVALPVTLPWQVGLIEKAQYILRATPLAFREKARVNMVQQAEYKAVEEGGLEVLESHVMQAFVQITPPFQHQTLYEAMKMQGIDADKYLDEKVWSETP
jgi:hypothetical protein